MSYPLNWKSLSTRAEFNRLVEDSREKPALIFKHRPSSPESAQALQKLESEWTISPAHASGSPTLLRLQLQVPQRNARRLFFDRRPLCGVWGARPAGGFPPRLPSRRRPLTTSLSLSGCGSKAAGFAGVTRVWTSNSFGAAGMGSSRGLRIWGPNSRSTSS